MVLDTTGDQKVAVNVTREGGEMMMVDAAETAVETAGKIADHGTANVQITAMNHALGAPIVAIATQIRGIRVAVKEIAAEKHLPEILSTTGMFQLGILRFHSL